MKLKLLLPPVMLALAGCHSDAYYQEKAVESARQFIYTHARELTPEQFAFVKMTPPVLLNGNIFGQSELGADNLPSREKRQICIAWQIPEKDTAYLVFGMSEPRMAFWRPLRLIRRPLAKAPAAPGAALTQARNYAVTSFEQQLSFADLNIIRFRTPQAAVTSFELNSGSDFFSKDTRLVPWGKQKHPAPGSGRQISLLWQLGDGRFAVFCGIGKPDLSGWQICMAGIMDKEEVKKSTVRIIKDGKNFFDPVREKNKKIAEPAKPKVPSSTVKPAEKKINKGGK